MKPDTLMKLKFIFKYSALGLIVVSFFFQDSPHFKKVLGFGVLLLAISLMITKTRKKANMGGENEKI